MTGHYNNPTWQVTDTISTLLNQLLAIGQDTAALGEAVGGAWLRATLARFRSGTDPAGKPWLTSQRVRLSGGKTLLDKLNLENSLDTAVVGDTVLIGSNIVYAAIHQFGGTIQPKTAKTLAFQLPGGAFVSTKKVTIPARPYVGFGADDEQRITGALKQHLAQLT